MRYVLGVLILAGAILLHGVLIGAQSARVPNVTIYRAGIYCVVVAPGTGVAVFGYEVYDDTYLLAPCPTVTTTTPKIMAMPKEISDSLLNHQTNGR